MAYTPTQFYDATGNITASYFSDLKVWIGKVVPTTANGFTVDISSAGFTDIKTVTVLPMKNTASANDMPTVAIKTLTNTSLSLNIRQGNNATVQIAGMSVLSGLPMIFPADVSGITLYIRVTGK